MNCANDYCLHNKGLTCTLDGINIDSKGMCDESILIRLDSDFIESEKERQFIMTESEG